MLKIKHKVIAVILCLTQAIILIACAFQEERVNVAEKKAWETGPTLEETSRAITDGESAGLRIITDNVYASYSMPEIQDVQIYKAKRKVISEKAFFSFFSDTPKEHPKYPGSGHYILEQTGETGNRKPEGAGSAYQCYFTKQGNLYDSWVSAAMYYKGSMCLESYEINTQKIDKALEKTITDTLALIEEDGYSYKVYEIPEDFFWEVNRCQIENNMEGAAKTDPNENEKAFGDYEEFYYVKIFPVIKVLPVMYGWAEDSNKGIYITGTNLYMIIVNNNLEAFRYDAAYQIESEKGEETVIITPKEAEEAIKIKYNNLISFNPVTLIDLSLVYCPIPHKFNIQDGTSDYYNLTPAWQFTDDKGGYIYINAITGKEL